MPTTTISSRGQVVLPAEIRKQDDLQPGEELEVKRVRRGEYLLVRRAPPANAGLINWLLDCPQKGYFVPLDSESTDEL